MCGTEDAGASTQPADAFGRVSAAIGGDGRHGRRRADCDDELSEALVRYAQALRHSADLLAAHGNESYEAHVALRTVRTVAEVERVTPAQRVDWALQPEAKSGIKWTIDTQTLVNQGRHITEDADAATGGGGASSAARNIVPMAVRCPVTVARSHDLPEAAPGYMARRQGLATA